MTPEYRDLYMRYLGALSVLGDAGAYVPTDDPLHDSITAAMEDAAAHHPVRVRRVLNCYDIKPVPAEEKTSDGS